MLTCFRYNVGNPALASTMCGRHCSSMVWTVYIVLLWISWWSASVVAQSCPPEQYTTVPENMPIGSVVFNLTFSADVKITITNKSARDSGYLALRHLSSTQGQVVLEKSLDLLKLNPQSPPKPDTDESVTCNDDNSTAVISQPTKKEISYNMMCDVTSLNMQVESSMILAIEDVNDNAPYFMCSPYYKTVNELTPVGTTIFKMGGLAADMDINGGIYSFNIESGGEDKFTLTGGGSDGFIQVKGDLDYDNGKTNYALNVSVKDLGEPPLSNWTFLYINISDGNDLNPVFTQSVYNLELPEQNSSNLNKTFTSTPPVLAYDQDRGIDSTILYALESGHIYDGITYFTIEKETGKIISLQLLNRNIIPDFSIKIKAYEEGKELSRIAYSTLVVKVLDVNSNPPIMWRTSYLISIAENSPDGHRVLQASATDKDEGLNAEFEFSLLDPSGAFSINALSGEIKVKNSSVLDRERHSSINMTVFAQETKTAEHYRSNNCSITVTLLDVNDNSPVFEPSSSYTFFINSAAEVATLVGTVTANDRDTSYNADVKYKLLFATGEGLAKFRINATSGSIYTSQRLDGADAPSYSLTVQAQDQSVVISHRRSSVASVLINITRTNDQPPAFIGAPYHAEISEASPAGTTVINIAAQDLDSDSALTFHFLDSETGHLFRYESNSHVLNSGHIITTSALDRENTSSYSIMLGVSDGKYMVNTTVNVTVLDENDNSPHFSADVYNFTVQEELEGAVIGMISANDLDEGENGQISYSINEPWANSHLSINASTGVLSASRAIDREKSPSLSVQVIAMDNGQNRRTGIAMVTVSVLDINDHAPQFLDLPYEVKVHERSQPANFFAVKATDADLGDNSLIRYSLIGGDQDVFSMNETTGSLSMLKPVDLEDSSASPSYNLTILAYNVVPYEGPEQAQLTNATSAVIVNIIDVNDNIPVFSLDVYHVSIAENQTIGSSVVNVKATDGDRSPMNSQVMYWISGGTDSALFRINPQTGLITLWSQLDRDPPSSKTHCVIEVSASDLVADHLNQTVIHNVTCTVNVTVLDVNDNAPVFTKDIYEVNVFENTNNQTVIYEGIQAVDVDQSENGRVTYELITQNVPFAVNMSTGKLLVTGYIDFESQNKTYMLNVSAYDGGIPVRHSSCKVQVSVQNVNDNGPIFLAKNYTFHLEENKPKYSHVGVVRATDLDGDHIEYLVESSAIEFFKIDSSSGTIISSGAYDHEVTPVYSFIVIAKDISAGGATISSSVPVTVIITDVNDNVPTFTAPQYNISVNEDYTGHVVKLTAEDKDSGLNGEVTYSIISGNSLSIFLLNATSGDLYVQKPELFDVGSNLDMILMVQAQDGGNPKLSSLTKVQVTIKDINNHLPTFSQAVYYGEVPENHPVGSFVVKVSAFDEDKKDQLIYSIISSQINFVIDNVTGIIRSAAVLDREQTPSHVLNVSVFDGKYQAFTEVKVQVMDMNDNAPVFSQLRYEKTIGQDTSIGKSVLAVTATDEDFGNNGSVTYWISDTDGKFKIDFSIGVIKVAGKLDLTIKRKYEMRVYCRDLGWPTTHISNVTVTISINDTNRYPPEFDKFAYDVNITEDTPLNTTIVTIGVFDRDSDVAGMTQLKILQGNHENTFVLEDDGKLLLNSYLDFEKTKYYELVVQAVDRAESSLTSTTRVRITVTDVNDNAPVFLTTVSKVNLKNPVDGDTMIFTFLAVDADSSLNGNNNVTYTLTPQSTLFSIGHLTGELRTTTMTDNGTHSLTIVAFDQGQPRLNNTLNVIVAVIDTTTSDLPVFSPVFYIGYNEVEKTSGKIITDVNASIKALAVDDGIFYNISSGLEADHYTIDSSTGIITSNMPVLSATPDVHYLDVSAFNARNPLLQSHAGVMIKLNLTSTNLHTPYFPFSEYAAEIIENSAVDSTVITLRAIDEDPHAVLTYSITEDNSPQLFKLLPQDGAVVVQVANSPDREVISPDLNDIYSLKISVHDGSRRNFTKLVIKIKDVNDNLPYFPVLQNNVSIYENIGPCEEFIKLQAVDVDLVDDQKLTYSIVSGNADNKFTISNSSGVISRSCEVKGQLDRETTDHYLLTVSVHDSLNHNATAYVSVNILDANDETPSFEGQPYTATVHEGGESLSLKVNITAADKDVKDNAMIDFEINSSNQEYFNITSVTREGIAQGEIHVVKALDREKVGIELVNNTAVYRVVVRATDRGVPSRSLTTEVLIYVKDINDNPPVFERNFYSQSISEGTPVGTPVIQILATDADIEANTNLTYSLKQDQNNGTFSIGIFSGEVKLQKKLSITSKSHYNLTVKVSDGIFNAETNLFIQLVDINDHDPVFTQHVYHFNATENDATGIMNEVIGIVSATDLDQGMNGQVTYQITSRNAVDRFTIQNVSNGEIMVIGTLDRETDEKYTLIVMATDGGVPRRMSTCEVEVSVLDVNDNAPQFVDDPYIGTVQEHAKKGTAVFIFPLIKATDKDKGKNAVVHYELSGDGSELFHIDRLTAAVTIGTDNINLLDREKRDAYDLQIIAVDGENTTSSLQSNTSLSIKLTDINDQAPVFTSEEYVFNVSETAPSNELIGRLEANDEDLYPNNRTIYYITDGGDGRFYIDKLTGELFVTGGLDREVKNKYTLQISAIDGGTVPGPLEGHTKVTITISDSNDNSPVFQTRPLVFSVLENESIGTFVGKAEASDIDQGDNSVIKYFINESVPFEIDEFSGNISTTQVLDRETVPKYNFNLFARDNGNPSHLSMVAVTANVLDDNDNRPQFEQKSYSVNILEKQPVDSVIALTRAFDLDLADNANISYSLHGENGSEKYFRIEPMTGLVHIAKSIDKMKLIQEGVLGSGNSSKDSILKLMVFGTDAGIPRLHGNASLFIKVDTINDDNPTFTNATYDVQLIEESPPGTSVVTVKATTKDDTTIIRYSLLNSDLFTVPDDTRGLILTAGTRLDRETRDRYSFTVQAVDNRIPQRTAYTVVSVLLTDINDNKPLMTHAEYNLSLVEGDYDKHELTVITANDVDLGQNKQLKYDIINGNEGNVFHIDNDGTLTVTGIIDRETTEMYSIEIMVRDMGKPALNSTCNVKVTVLDINDQSPVFLNLPYKASVNENLPAGQEVITITASDADVGLNAALHFHIQSSSNSQAPFYIQNKGTYGILKTLSLLDYEKVSSYSLTVAASDLGTPSRTSYTSVMVSVTDVLDTQPKFSSDLYEVHVAVNTSVGTEIIRLTAGLGKLYYNITDGNFENYFTINHTSGSLRLTKPLSLTNRLYEIIITACDYEIPPNKAATKVRVIVRSTSEMPEFEKPVYSVTYEENRTPPHMLLDLNSTDERPTNKLTYNIVSGHYNGKFTIEKSTGKLWCNEKLDREAQSKYIIRIQCDFINQQITQVSRKRRDTTDELNVVEVVVDVADVNDNAPYFTFNPVVAAVTSDATFNSHVTTVQATDDDTGNNSALHYTISGGLDQESFYIDTMTGHVYSKISIRQSKKQQFLFSVNATDNWGKGHSARTEVKILVLTDSQRVILVALIPPMEFKIRQAGLIRNLSLILGWQVHEEKIEAHIENTDSGPAVDVTRTDFYFYATDNAKGIIVPKEQVLERMRQKAKEIEALFRLNKIDEVKGVTKYESYSMDATAIALIVISVLIFFGSILTVFIVCYAWKQRERERKNSDQLYHNIQRHTSINPLQLTNPLFLEAEQMCADNSAQPLHIDPAMLSVFDVEHMAESKLAGIEETAVKNEAFTVNHNNKPTMVVHTLAPPAGQGRDQDSWVFPYEGDDIPVPKPCVVQNGVIRTTELPGMVDENEDESPTCDYVNEVIYEEIRARQDFLADVKSESSLSENDKVVLIKPTSQSEEETYIKTVHNGHIVFSSPCQARRSFCLAQNNSGKHDYFFRLNQYEIGETEL